MICDVVNKIKDFLWNEGGTGLLNFSFPDIDFGKMKVAVMQAVGQGMLPEKDENAGMIKKLAMKAFPDALYEFFHLDPKTGLPLGGMGAQTTGQGRAKGGSVAPSALSIVGERGPEFFVPQSRGTVIPSDVSQVASLLAMGAGGGGGGSTTTNVSINAPTTATTTAVSNTSENIMGASDTYTALARAYG